LLRSLTAEGFIPFVLLVLVLSGCSSNGSNDLPSRTGTESPAKAPVSLRVLIPHHVQHTRIRPQYLSASTASASIAVNGGSPTIANLTAGSPGCVAVANGTECTIFLAVPLGKDTFSISTFDSANATGNELSTGSVTQTILAGQENTVNVTLDGIVSKIVLALQSFNPQSPPPEGSKASFGVTVMAEDADGNTIVGPGAYDNPIALTDTDPSGTTSLSTATVSDPATSVTLTYSGGPLSSAGENALVTAASSGVCECQITNVYFFTAQQSWTTWGGNSPSKNSYNANETTLTEGNIGSLKTTPVWTFTNTANGGGGFIVDEPIVAGNVSTTSQGPIDLLYIGDEHADFYAINAGTGSKLWSTKESTFLQNCGDFPDGLYGFSGTPVLDPASNVVYAVDGLEMLYGFDAASGTVKVGPVNMEPDGLRYDHTYGALTYDPGHHLIYATRGGHCSDPETGGITSYNTTSGAVSAFYAGGTPPNSADLDGIWGPAGVSIDPRYPNVTDLYAGVGDGTLNSQNATAYGQSVIRLNSSLGVVGFQTPVTSGIDQDFGDTPLVIAPANGCGTMLIAENKNAQLFVYSDVDSISSGIIAGPNQSLQIGTASQYGDNLATPAYDPNTNLVFVPNGSDAPAVNGIVPYYHGLLAFGVNSNCTLNPAPVWAWVGGPNQTLDGPPAPPTIVKGADGKTMVFYSDGPSTAGCTGIGGYCNPKSDIVIFDAASGQVLKQFQAPSQVEAAPVVVNGHLYLAGFTGTSESASVYAYSL
jgi:hypothetical protein